MDFAGYFFWLKSRQWIIKSKDGDQFMRNMQPSENWMEEIPSEFYVGDELVTFDDYKTRIQAMNLQFNNLEDYVFEIEGSCLFRDLIFNINKVGAWAQSNRFLFSILDEVERFNEEHYHISSEYKDIPEWEDQFDKYMKLIKEDPIVDHNRLEMPYSISSTFWISINRKTLTDLLSFLKFYAPFFYKIYGKQFIAQAGIDEKSLSYELSASISQYIMKDKDKWEEGSWNIQGTQIVNSKMGLILYSQFIRQADTRIVGLFDILMHKNPIEFSHKVFKGNTILNISYVADIDKVLSTVRTRLCAFAMSSGDDPCSWSYFLNNFLPKELTPEKLMELLPCKFKEGRLLNCKYHDDIKFRNEGKEISNCPCPLVTLSMKDAQSKKDRDNNRIGNAFYDLTEYLVYNGVPCMYKSMYWTSKLEISTPTPLRKDFIETMESFLNELETRWEDVLSGKLTPDAIIQQQYHEFILGNDPTCLMKGLAIDWISDALRLDGIDKFIINFGGDVYGYNVKSIVSIENTNFNIELNGHWSVFTSGNTQKRGNHIVGGNEHEFVTVVYQWGDEAKNLLADIYATKKFAGDAAKCNKLKSMMAPVEVHEFFFKEEGYLIDKTYCASPFFNEEQIKIRDNMVSKLITQFRPDLTDSAYRYNDQLNNDCAADVVKDNIDGITNSKYLVFPNRTTDLGTLYEVGFAIYLGHPIIKYDEVHDKYIIVFVENDMKYSETEEYLFDCSKKRDCISLGVMSGMAKAEQIYYTLNGCKDNIMLSVNYNHVELVNGKYELQTRDENERDE
jgi:nucleoside 2-deoxyribosyltransferase